MRIVITTIGSRGDIQPYIALGNALKEKGHDVVIATHPWAKELLNSWNLKHIPVGSDIDIHYTAKQFVEHSANNLKSFKFALNFIFRTLRNCHPDIMTIIKEADLVIGHGITGSSEADILNKPFITVSVETMGLQKEYRGSGNFINVAGIYLVDQIKGAVFGKPYRKFRKETGAPPAGTKREFPYLAIAAISPMIRKKNPLWKQVTELTGFFFAGIPDNFTPDDELKRFINSGEKPVLITFGSMFHQQEDTNRIFRIICDALKLSNARALLLMPDLDQTTTNIPENLFLINNIPYSWLLPQTSLVVHHFGFGTTAEVLKAGIPAVPVPHIFDQKMRASEIYKMGLCTKPLDIKSLTSTRLACAIVQAKTDKKMIELCRETGLKISEEDGVGNAVRLIENYLKCI